MTNKLSTLLLLLITLTGLFLRIYNIDWSKDITWHPDERDMAVAVSNIKLPDNLLDLKECFNKASSDSSCNLNPHYSVYGNLPLYLGFINGISYNLLFQSRVSRNLNISEATIGLRITSVVASVISIILVFYLGRILMDNFVGTTSAVLSTFTPGLIQAAHFGTTESLVALMLLVVTLFTVKIYKNGSNLLVILAGAAIGMSLGIKISTYPFFIPIIVVIILNQIKKDDNHIVVFWRNIFSHILLLLSFSLIFTFISSPFYFIDFKETKILNDFIIPVAIGKIQTFYTKQFTGTVPIAFQYTKILPFSLGLVQTILGSAGLVVLALYSVRRGNLRILLTLLSFIIFFVANSFVFAKWARYVVPSFYFYSLGTAFILTLIKKSLLRYLLATLVIAFNTLHGFALFNVYLKEDVRFTASNWIYNNIPSRSVVISETGNVTDIPILPKLQRPKNYKLNITNFNFYELEDSKNLQTGLSNLLYSSEYIFVPSRRVFKNYLPLEKDFPKVSNYYKSLFNGNLGFKEIKEFNSFPSIKVGSLELTIPDENAEETFSVFDHPVIRIYKKERRLSIEEYEKLITEGQADSSI